MKNQDEKKIRPITAIQFYILTALAEKDLNQAEFRGRAVEISYDQCGTDLTFHKYVSMLVRKGWIRVDTFRRRAEDPPERRYYHLLPAGRAALAEEVRRLELLVENINQKLSLAKQQLSLPIPPPFEPTVLKIQSTLPSRRAIKNRIPVSVIKDLRKRKAVAALRQKPTMSVQELALCLSISRSTIYRWCEKRILEFTRPSGEQEEAGAQQVTTASVLRAIEAEEHD